MIRLAALLAWFLILSTVSLACDALILIQPGVAESQFSSGASDSSLWVLWPTEVYRQGHSGLLSLVTGVDWLGSNLDVRFSTVPDGRLRAENGADLERRGFFDLRRRFLDGLPTFALAGPQRSFRETTLLLSVEGAKQPIRVLEAGETWPAEGLLVYEASSWSDLERVARRVQRALVVEYPPREDRPWTRYWLLDDLALPREPVLGDGGFPGVTPARLVLRLLTSPSRFRWAASDPRAASAIPEWLEMIRVQAPKWVTGFGSLLAVLLSVGLVLALRERRSRLLTELLLVCLVSPAASVLAGNLVCLFPVHVLPVAFGLCLVAVYGASKIGQLALLRWVPDAHRLLGPALVSWAAFSVANPLWSPLSGVFSANEALPAAALGCWFASMTASCGFVRGSSLTLEWLIRVAMVAMAAAPVFTKTWWGPTPIPFAALPIISLAFGDGFWRISMSPALPIFGALTAPGLLYGVAWKPGGLLSRAADSNKLDWSQYVSFLISPLFVATFALVFLFSLLGDRFLLHQYRRLVLDDPRRLVVFSASFGLGLIGLTQPMLLSSALWSAVGGLTILVAEGVYVL